MSDTPQADDKSFIKIEERVKAAFSKTSISAYSSDYLEALRANWQQLETDIKQAAIFILLFVIVFELITRAAVAEVTLGIFKISDITLVYRAIPAIAAYFCHNLIYLAALRKKIENTHDAVI